MPNEKWGVFFKSEEGKAGAYYISKTASAPALAERLDEFYAEDKDEALCKGSLIIETHIWANANSLSTRDHDDDKG